MHFTRNYGYFVLHIRTWQNISSHSLFPDASFYFDLQLKVICILSRNGMIVIIITR